MIANPELNQDGEIDMRLYYARSSPFARKVRIAAHELALSSCIKLIEVDPWSSSELRSLNPLSKVPTLAIGAETVLYESNIICEFLGSLKPEPVLYPPQGVERWQALLLQGLADGASTAAGRLYAAEHRADAERSPVMMRRFQSAIEATLDSLETSRCLEPEVTIGVVSVAAFTGYLDFRWPDRDWRLNRPYLSGWSELFSKRPSMTTTEHI